MRVINLPLSLTVIDARWMAVARGDAPADLVLAGGRVLSVFTKEWLDVDVAIVDGHVVGLGRYEGRERIDVRRGRVRPAVAPQIARAHVVGEDQDDVGRACRARRSRLCR